MLKEKVNKTKEGRVITFDNSNYTYLISAIT